MAGFDLKEGYYEELREEFYYFKLNQIIMYMISSHNEDYFQLAKKNLLELHLLQLQEVEKLILMKLKNV